MDEDVWVNFRGEAWKGSRHMISLPWQHMKWGAGWRWGRRRRRCKRIFFLIYKETGVTAVQSSKCPCFTVRRSSDLSARTPGRCRTKVLWYSVWTIVCLHKSPMMDCLGCSLLYLLCKNSVGVFKHVHTCLHCTCYKVLDNLSGILTSKTLFDLKKKTLFGSYSF